MKKIAFLVLALIGMKVANAQMVTTSDFSKNYGSYDGKVVTVKEVSGTVKAKINYSNPSVGSSVNSKVGSTAPSTAPNPKGSTSSPSTSCKTITGYQVVDFTFNSSNTLSLIHI